jgi:hypothetical protein
MTHTEREWRDGQPDGTGLGESTSTGRPAPPAADAVAEHVHENDQLAERVHEDDPLVEDVQDVHRPAEPAYGGPGSVASEAGTGQEQPAGLGSAGDHERFVARWTEIQAEFVDEPRRAVDDADALVVDMMDRLARMLASERERLGSFGPTGQVSTEDLRQGLQRYRALFEWLLAIEIPAGSIA